MGRMLINEREKKERYADKKKMVRGKKYIKDKEKETGHIPLHALQSQSLTVSDPDSKSFKKLLEMFQISLEKMQ